MAIGNPQKDSLQDYVVGDLGKGLRGKESDSKVPDGFGVSGTQNVRFLRSAVNKRPGLHDTGTGPLSGRIQKFFDYYTLSRTQFPIALTTSNWYYLNIGTNVWTSIRSSLTGSNTIIPQACVFGGNFVSVDGVDAPAEWSGTGSATALIGGAPTTARYILNYASHLLLGSPTIAATAKPQRIMWSDFNDENQWASGDAGFFDFADSDDQMQQLMLLTDFGVVVRNKSIWLISPTQSPIFYLFDRRVDVAGTVATGTVAVIPTGIIYLGEDGMVYLFNGVASQAIGEGVWPLFRGNIPYPNISKAVSEVDPLNGTWTCCIPYGSGTDNTAAIVYNYFEGTFSFDTAWVGSTSTVITGLGRIASVSNVTWNLQTQAWNTYSQTWTDAEFAAGQPLVYASTGTDVLYFSGDLNDKGSAINAVFVLPLRDFKLPTRLKQVKKVAIYYTKQTTGSLSVQLGATNFDDVTQATYSAASSIDMSQAGKIIAYFDDPTPSIYHNVKISNNITNQGMNVSQIVYTYADRGPVLGA